MPVHGINGSALIAYLRYIGYAKINFIKMNNQKKFESFRICEIPSSKLVNVWGGAVAVTGAGTHTAGEGTPGQTSIKFSGDAVTTWAGPDGSPQSSTTYTDEQCIDGCNAPVDPGGNIIPVSTNTTVPA